MSKAMLSLPVAPLTSALVGAGGAGWAYKRLNNPRAAMVAGGFSAAYLFAGYVPAWNQEYQ